MTSVVGILNKEGVVLAADSAVTRTKYIDKDHYTKIATNGNKMIRLLDKSVPMCIMVVGTSNYMDIPWDIIVRRFRQKNVGLKPQTVMEAAELFLQYVDGNAEFENYKFDKDYIEVAARELYIGLIKDISQKVRKPDLNTAEKLAKDFLRKKNKTFTKLSNPTMERLKKDTEFWDKADIIVSMGIENVNQKEIPPVEIQLAVHSLYKEFRETLQMGLCSHVELGFDRTILVFSGFGSNEKYPSLVAAEVYNGLNNIINYKFIQIVEISDREPAAICPFGQVDVMDSVLYGFSQEWEKNFSLLMKQHTNYPKTVDKVLKSLKERSIYNWLKSLKNYDLPSMAMLAKNLIDLTGFNRVLTFQEESVGGTLDIGVISKVNGFSWLSRKSWYHKFDVKGKYGSMGI